MKCHEKLAVVVVGASGHLARTKIFPALFSLHCQDCLPDDCIILGYARTEMDAQGFRESISENLTCRYTPEAERCSELMETFLSRCHYASGQYDSRSDLAALRDVMKSKGAGDDHNRLIYLAVPPSVFTPVTDALGDAGFITSEDGRPWSRVVIEKPFGTDRASSDALTCAMARVISEDQTYRIDHYLGKEVVQNLLVLRFANLVFEPIWNRNYVESVHITWMENVGIQGRGGYFDDVGIIRDVMQNHLLQMLSLVAMEAPSSLAADHIRDEKVKVLRNVPPLRLSDTVIGQYTGTRRGGIEIPGYLEDESVPEGSRTATYAAAVLQVVNHRWDGVPFFVRAGKALHARTAEIRLRFRHVPGMMFRRKDMAASSNELVIRIQPDEAIYLTVMNKVPGMAFDLTTSLLDLQYNSAFSQVIPDAYESLLLDVIEGDKSLFIRDDELAASWDVFTPLLTALETQRVQPEPYHFGTHGPAAAHGLAAQFGIEMPEGSAADDDKEVH